MNSLRRLDRSRKWNTEIVAIETTKRAGCAARIVRMTRCDLMAMGGLSVGAPAVADMRSRRSDDASPLPLHCRVPCARPRSGTARCITTGMGHPRAILLVRVRPPLAAAIGRPRRRDRGATADQQDRMDRMARLQSGQEAVRYAPGRAALSLLSAGQQLAAYVHAAGGPGTAQVGTGATCPV